MKLLEFIFQDTFHLIGSLLLIAALYLLIACVLDRIGWLLHIKHCPQDYVPYEQQVSKSAQDDE